MQASDLDLRELLQFEPDGGFVRFAGQRALFLDTLALGILRRELIRVIGETGARGVLTRFGYAHGWRSAASIRELLPKGDQAEWQRMGARLHMLKGMVRVEPAAADAADPTAMVDHYWHDSYEAEQHILQLGPEGAAALGPQSPAMRKVLELAKRVAQVDATILVTGESGSGKERIARLIHAGSPRAGGPFLAVNCGAVPESLLESELFGHARGAFTGAIHDRVGLFEAAQGGTLFLDEIGEVPPPMQVKLLRALQEREVRRVGENRNRAIDVRVLAATNRDLLAEVHAARFRQDLYYRLRVIELKVPALRERREDILPLARHFMEEAARRNGREVAGFTPEAANQLIRYPWPGNVRELENAVEHAVVLARTDRIDLDDLPEEVGRIQPGVAVEGDSRTPLQGNESGSLHPRAIPGPGPPGSTGSAHWPGPGRAWR
jgi:DNA-binding NtrC family response regulator